MGCSSGARLLCRPRVRSVIVEAALALPLLFVMWFALAAAILTWEIVSGTPIRPPSVRDSAARSPDRARFILIVLLATTIGPMAEESLFRGLIYNALRRRLPILPAAVLRALAFGFLHPYGLTHGALASGLGLAFALVYEWRKTLLAPILLHALQNTAVVVVALAAAGAPILGIMGEPADGGCRVTRVWPGSAAEEAGLREGDVIVTVAGRPVTDRYDVAEAIRWRRPGDVVEVTFFRDGRLVRVEAALRARE